MGDTRRTLLLKLAGAAAGAVLLRDAVEAQRSPQPMPSPNAPSNQNIPAGLDAPEIVHPNRAARAATYRTEIRGDVEKLYQWVLALRDEVAHTDVNVTLPLTIVKRAQDIEKLAKQIKEHAKG